MLGGATSKEGISSQSVLDGARHVCAVLCHRAQPQGSEGPKHESVANSAQNTF
jgi:hypothetical protein